MGKICKGDVWIWRIFTILCVVGILVTYSTSEILTYRNEQKTPEDFLFNHFILAVFSLISAFICHRIKYTYYSKISRGMMLVSVVLLIIAWKGGATYNEASRWIDIPLINYTFQPSDLAKLALIVNLAAMLHRREEVLASHFFSRRLIEVFICCGIICGLISATNWSEGLILYINCLVILIISHVPLRPIIVMVLISGICIFLATVFGQRGSTVKNRLSNFIENKKLFQESQSYMAIASGGIFWGKGPGKSIQKNFLPHAYSDFIFAILIEEYGLLGGVFIITLYLMLIWRAHVIIKKSKTYFQKLLVIGLILAVVVQALMHMLVVVGLLPITGLTLPMISMGGNSLLFNGMTFGIILSVSRENS